MIRRPPRSTQGVSSAASDVYKRQLKMFTIWPAFAAFQEDIKGTIEVGKLADLTVFSKDIMKVPEEEIIKTQAVMTIVNGQIVFEL